jgi:integrase
LGTAVYSGCRMGELLALRWTDVDLERGSLAVRRTLIRVEEHRGVFGEPKTARSRRTVTLPAEAVDALRAHKVRQNTHRLQVPGYASGDLAFATGAGTPPNSGYITRAFKRALDRAELPRSIRFHDLRHFAGSLMLSAGIHPKVASERLGHASVAITLDLYSHVLEGLDRDAADKVQDALRGKTSLSGGHR